MRQQLGVAPVNPADPIRLSDAANPTALVGLTAKNGSAKTWKRSDAASALDISIAPTWTGAHTFSAAITANAGLTVRGAAFSSRGISDNASVNALAISASGNVSVAVPSSTSSTIGGYAVNISAPTTSGASYGVLIMAGTSAADLALQVLNAAVSADLFAVAGNGAISLPSVATQTTSPAAGTAGILPTRPTGYFSLSIAGYAAKIPYY